MTDQISNGMETPPPTTPLGSLTTIEQAIEAMLDGLQLSPLTKQTYGCGLAAFLRFMQSAAQPTANEEKDDHGNPPPHSPILILDITEEALYGFSLWLRDTYPDPRGFGNDQGATTRTAKTYAVAAKRLMNWLDLHDLLPDGVTYERMVRRIDQGRGRRREGYRQRKADPETVRVLSFYLRQPLPEKRGPRRLSLLRNRALMSFLYDTGVRISEALALSREDVLDGRATKIRLTETKNGKPRTVFMSDETRKLLSAYLRERQDSLYAPLFASHGRDKGTSITPSHAWLLVKKAARAEGLYETTSPHSLRHRRAQDLLDEGMPLEWVAALLGHAHPDTTRVVYAWETDEERLADMVATYGLTPSQADAKTQQTRWPTPEDDEPARPTEAPSDPKQD